MGIVIELAFSVLMEVFLYNLGRVVVFVLSFGRARSENLREIIGRKKPEAPGAKQKIIVQASVTQLIGGLTLTAALTLLLTM